MTGALGLLFRPVLRTLAVCLALAAPVAVQAAPDVGTQVAQQLAQMGYGRISVKHTLLGKVVVTGWGNGHEREIVVDPRSGAILRDLVRRKTLQSGQVSAPKLGGSDSNASGLDLSRGGSDDDRSGSGPGRDDDRDKARDDDDRDDDRADDRDDDRDDDSGDDRDDDRDDDRGGNDDDD